jgi:hypothetical protein
MGKKAKATVLVNAEGDAVCVRLKCGKRSATFHQREYQDQHDLATAVAQWLHQHRANGLVPKQRRMTGEELLAESLENGFILTEIIMALAAEAEGLEKWDGFPTECLADIAEIVPVHVSYVEGIFHKISRAFTPMVFCELAAAEDRPEDFASDPTFLTPMNDYGNTRADRMVSIDLRK